MNVVLRLREAAVEFLWVVVGGVCKLIFVSNQTTVLRLCYVVLLLGLWQFQVKLWYNLLLQVTTVPVKFTHKNLYFVYFLCNFFLGIVFTLKLLFTKNNLEQKCCSTQNFSLTDKYVGSPKNCLRPNIFVFRNKCGTPNWFWFLI